MSQPVKNLRLRRTQKLLREALIELIEERSFETLTVGEITERALVSRAAFYRNYQDKYDLVEQIFAEAIQALLNAVAEPGTEHPPQIWVKFFEHIAEYERLYRALLGRKGSPWFVLKMRASLIDLLKELALGQPALAQLIAPTSDEFIPNLVATLFVEAITWWLEQGRPSTAQEMANRCISLASAIFQEAGTWK
ncbi:MAG TPA: TetR/AcrR family transcriptional regulator [Phototrophicaceae bacterium]|nr:TetR/AcrR family transcriptional regulator [Phototrophicaceae bacterium]